MTWRIAVALLGCALLTLANRDRARTNPGRYLELFPNGVPVRRRRTVIVTTTGFFLLVFGCAGLQVLIGAWAFGVFGVLILVATVPVFVHNRGMRGRPGSG